MIFQVEMGEGIVSCAPHIIRSVGIGSCVAVTLYNPHLKIGGLAHIMFPESLTSHTLNFSASAYQYADTAINTLLEEMSKKGAARGEISAKIAGGAKMFSSYSGFSAGIGEQNIKSIKALLETREIPLIGIDTGGNYGRSVEFYLDSGKVVVKAFGREDREI